MKNLILFLSIVLTTLGCKQEYELQVTLSPSEGGIVSPESGKYEEGEEVTIRLTPNSDYRFIEWSGDWVGSENPITITMDKDYSITGNLESPIYLDENGVTIKCRDWVEVGETYEYEGNSYTVVDEEMLNSIVRELDYPFLTTDLTKYCTSNVQDMSRMFYGSQFNGDISNWDVSNVQNMHTMFELSQFNGDISNWDVSNVQDMNSMFYRSQFNGDISNWDVSNVQDMYRMFSTSQFNGDISNWNVSNVQEMHGMFSETEFNLDLSTWNVMNVTSCDGFMSSNSVWTLPRPLFQNCECYCN